MLIIELSTSASYKEQFIISQDRIISIKLHVSYYVSPVT